MDQLEFSIAEYFFRAVPLGTLPKGAFPHGGNLLLQLTVELVPISPNPEW